jgi:formylglycine-generating enzyme required for sulfatase activity
VKRKDVWDIADILLKAVNGLVGVLIPAVIAWGIHVYNKRQHETERIRLSNEFKLRQLQTAREFLPHLLADQTKWAALTLIRALGDEDFARQVSGWYISQLLKEEDREQIERLKADKDPAIAALAAQAIRINYSQQASVQPVNVGGQIETNYWYKTTESIRPAGPVSYADGAEERYGRFVATRGKHKLVLPAEFRMAIYLVSNEFFLEFVRDRGYEKDAYWIEAPPGARAKFRCQDGQSIGPSTWPTNEGCLPGRERHPVAGIGYYEALAFCRWLQEKHQPEAGWRWRVPTEDMWEFTARTEEGFRYPWGNEFKSGACNSVETGNRTTTDVNTFPEGKTRHGCFDMAGNVWELVVADDVQAWSCVLRGGSYRNNRHEVRSYLRLFSVPRDHRPPDFGFRCAQVPAGV